MALLFAGCVSAPEHAGAREVGGRPQTATHADAVHARPAKPAASSPPPPTANGLASVPLAGMSAAAYCATGQRASAVDPHPVARIGLAVSPCAEVPPAAGDEDAPAEAEGGTSAPGSTPRRQERSPASQALLALAGRLQMPGATLDVPCSAPADSPPCASHALSPFFDALDRARAGTGRARVTVFGNSLHASDRIIDVWRARLQERFGDAGRGFLMIDRLAGYGGRTRAALRASGMTPHNVVWGPRGHEPHGVGGWYFEGAPRGRAHWNLVGESRARIFALASPTAGKLRISGEGPLTDIDLRDVTREGRIIDVPIPAHTARFELETRGGRSVLYGVSLEREEPGVLVDTLAIIGADPTRYLRADEALFGAQLAALGPDLVTVFLGGNEVKRIAWGSSRLAQVEEDLTRFLQRIHRAAPHASCLVIGPLENVKGGRPTDARNLRPVADPWETRPETRAVNDVMRTSATRQGCAFLDLFAAMGSEGSQRRLHDAGLLHEDKIHPRGEGLDVIGELVFDALMRHYEEELPLALP